MPNVQVRVSEVWGRDALIGGLVEGEFDFAMVLTAPYFYPLSDDIEILVEINIPLINRSGSSAVGANAVASAPNSVAPGAGSVASEANSVSVGSPGNERTITNVAPGVNPSDAVNMSRLNSVQDSVNSVARTAYSGIAAATALTMIPEVDQGKTLSVGIGMGSYQG